jgi:diguanylate cyclase (GGDEF)-like protein
MYDPASPNILLASPEPALLAAIEPVLHRAGARVEIVLSANAALAAMTAPIPPDLALLDVNLSGLAPENSIAQLLVSARAHESGGRFPIILISDTVTEECVDRLAEGVIDDLILRAEESSYWRLRIELALRAYRLAHEVESLHEAIALSAQMDRLTGVYSRQALLATLFRETDRVQRLNTPMTLVLFDLEDFGHWNARLGADACDELLCQVAARTARLLRSYDLLGRTGSDEFLVALPGCGIANAAQFAERLRIDVFSVPFHVQGESLRLSACFGIACSQGRSPVVVLREAEEALERAQATGPESIQCFGECLHTAPAPVTILAPGAGGELIVW